MRTLQIYFIIAALFSINSAYARVITSEKISYYSVSGKTGVAIFKAILKRGPKIARSGHVIAATTIQMRVDNIQVALKRGRCVVTNADVHLSLRYRFPKLRNLEKHSRKLQSAWKKFMQKVRSHEIKHGKIAKRLAKDLHRNVRKISGKISRKCKNFGLGAERKINRLASKSHARHARFDRREARKYSRMARLQKALFVAR